MSFNWPVLTHFSIQVGSAITATTLREHLGWEKDLPKALPPLTSGAMASKHGDGGWRTESLGPPYDYPAEDAARAQGQADSPERCDVDMLDGTRVDPDEVYSIYIMMNPPVLLRGLNENSPAWEAYTAERLREDFQGLTVHVSDIPYNAKFGSPNGKDEGLGR